MKIKHLTITGFGVILSFIFAISLFSLVSADFIEKYIFEIKNHPLIVSKASVDAVAGADVIQHDLLQYVLGDVNERKGFADSIDRSGRNITKQLVIIRANILNRKGRALALNACQIYSEWPKYRDRVFSLADNGDLAGARELLDGEIENYFLRFTDSCRKITDYSFSKLVSFNDKALAVSLKIKHFVFFITAISVVSAVLIALWMAFYFVMRVKTVEIAARKIAAGDLDHKIELTGSDEFVSLSQSLNSMAQGLKKMRDTLEARVTERTEKLDVVNKELQVRNDEMERIMYTVSHDLKSPLITVKGFLGFLEEDMAAGDLARFKKDASRIAVATEHMSTMLDQILDFSRIGRITNDIRVLSFTDLAAAAAQMVDGSLKNSNVRLLIEPDMPLVKGEYQRLLELVQNLIDNAVKFMGDQPSPLIEIGVREGEEPVFFVKDNGIGIENVYNTKIFGLFNKLDPRTEGTGIGLAIVRRVVETNDGRIWVESEGSKKGTTFCFTLPIQKEGDKDGMPIRG